MKSSKLALMAAILFASFQTQADSVSVISKVTHVYTYGTYENGNTSFLNQIVVKVEADMTDCKDGFFISSEDNTNNPAMVAILLSAFHSNSNVRFGALKNETWHGSIGVYCRIKNLALVK